MGGGAEGEGQGDRFDMRGELGVGSTGAVYRVFDRRRGEEVALKTLRRVSGADLYRFKREFRTLAGFHHPNLATLHELFVVDGAWMFTMELVDGMRFDEWVRPGGAIDQGRLRAALIQLADALCALHAADKIHRDLKPSNVLVDGDGRVVILDFGLVVAPDTDDPTHQGGSVGTIAYMSPEQAADRPLGPATDWYAVGVMLYEVLAGQRPIRGAAHDVMLRKQVEDALAPSDLAADVPADLDTLCSKLLDRDPSARPDGAAVLAALGASPSPATLALQARAAEAIPPCDPVALAILHDAFATSRTRFVIVVVTGPHGSGKSALLATFLDDLRRTTDTLVLSTVDSGREQTRMPGIDQAVDQLSAYVLGLPRHEAEEIIHDAGPLARVFPALRRVPALQMPLLPHSKPVSPEDVFGQGMLALRRLLHRVSARRPLVFAIDNARGPQGPDTRVMTEHLAGGADPPHMLLVTVMRSGFVDDNPTLANLRLWSRDHDGDLRFIELTRPG